MHLRNTSQSFFSQALMAMVYEMVFFPMRVVAYLRGICLFIIWQAVLAIVHEMVCLAMKVVALT